MAGNCTNIPPNAMTLYNVIQISTGRNKNPRSVMVWGFLLFSIGNKILSICALIHPYFN